MPSKPSSVRSRHLRDSILSSAPGLETAEALFDSIGDVLFCVKDRVRRYVAANDAFIKSVGLRHRRELIGQTARELFPAILAAGYEQQDEEVFAKGATVRDRLEMITHPDGGVGWFVSQKIAVRSVAGEVIALAGISRDLDIPAAGGGDLDALAGALETIHRDCAEPLRIEALARKSGLSWSQFVRRVRRVTGLRPRQLLTKARVETAAQMLRATEKSLAGIAFESGFYDQAAFCRQFRAATGLSPGEYRRAFRKV